MSPQLIIALVIAACSAATGFGTAWKIQDYFITKKENEDAQQKLAAIQLAAATTIRNLDNVITAQNNAASRERKLRADASGSRDALIGLSHATADALRTSEANHSACLATATTLGNVLETVTTERRELAEKADRHVNDLQTILDAWPK